MCTWFVSESADRDATLEHHRSCVWSGKREMIIGGKKSVGWQNLQRIVHTINSSHNGISNSCANWRQYWLTTVIATCSLMHLLSLESWKPRGWFPAALGVRCSPAKIQKQKYIQKLGCNYTIFQGNILIYKYIFKNIIVHIKIIVLQIWRHTVYVTCYIFSIPLQLLAVQQWLVGSEQCLCL